MIEKWEQTEYAPKAASTVYAANAFLAYDGSGHVVPAAATDPILGVCGEVVTAADPDYTSNRKIAYQPAGGFTFAIPVTTGTATAAMVGLPFDLDTASSLDVSAPGTQFVIRQYISATLVVVEAILLA